MYFWFSLLGRSREIVSIAAAPANLGPAVIKAKLKDQLVDVLIDTGASDNFINKRVADMLQIEGRGSAEKISLATTKAVKQARINLTYHMRCLRRREKHVIASNRMWSLLLLQIF